MRVFMIGKKILWEFYKRISLYLHHRFLVTLYKQTSPSDNLRPFLQAALGPFVKLRLFIVPAILQQNHPQMHPQNLQKIRKWMWEKHNRKQNCINIKPIYFNLFSFFIIICKSQLSLCKVVSAVLCILLGRKLSSNKISNILCHNLVPGIVRPQR